MKEEPDCEYYLGANGVNVCYPNAPYRCSRAKKEDKCCNVK